MTTREEEYRPLAPGPMRQIFRALAILLMVGGLVGVLFAIAFVYEDIYGPDLLSLSEVEDGMEVEFPEGTELIGAAHLATLF